MRRKKERRNTRKTITKTTTTGTRNNTTINFPRTLIFPFKLKGKPTPFGVMLLALIFCLYNGFVVSDVVIWSLYRYMQTSYHLGVAVYDNSWLVDPRYGGGGDKAKVG